MRSEIEKLISESGAEAVAVAFLDLASGDQLFILPDESFHPASTIKIAVMLEVFRQAEQGGLPLDAMLPVTNHFSSIVDGSPFSLLREDDGDQALYNLLGYQASVRELVRLMIVRSSNLATNLLARKVGVGAVTAFMQDLGAEGVTLARLIEDEKAYRLGINSATTARGLLHLLRLLAEGKAVSPDASREMIEILLGQEFNEGIPAGLPAGVPVAHKTGWFGDVYHDAGVVYPPDREPYVLVVLTRGIPSEERQHNLVAGVSRLVYAGAQ